MNLFALWSTKILLFSFSFSAHAVELKDLGLKVNPLVTPTPVLPLKGPPQVLGTCDGETYSNQAEYDGCIRNVSARALNPSPATAPHGIPASVTPPKATHE